MFFWLLNPPNAAAAAATIQGTPMNTVTALRPGSELLISLLIWAGVFCLSMAVYVRWIRPKLKAAGVLRWEEGLWERIKNRWDLVLSTALGLILALWNSILDLIVLAFNNWDAITGATSSLDLTPAWMGEKTLWALQTANILFTLARALYLINKQKDA